MRALPGQGVGLVPRVRQLRVQGFEASAKEMSLVSRHRFRRVPTVQRNGGETDAAADGANLQAEAELADLRITAVEGVEQTSKRIWRI